MPPAPPPQPQYPPPAGGDQGNRTLMIFLSYLWILAVIPLMVEKDDREVQWHAKHGLVLTVLEVLLYVALGVLSFVPVLGCVVMFVPFLVAIGFLVIRVLAIMKAMNGQRFTLPGISDFADKF
jgi:uncharacterized membrane protein